MFALLLACAHGSAPADPAPAAAPVVEPVSAPAVPLTHTVLTPSSIYAACRERVELPEVAGECQTDADCVKSGCSSEVCTSKSAAEGLLTSCEVQDCFGVLDGCGCQAGVCTWTLRIPPDKLQKLPIPITTP